MIRRLAAVGAVLGTALLVLAAPAAAERSAACDASGVTVVVDFSAFNQGVQTRCVAGDPGSGLDSLRAGFSTDMVSTQPGFVCRINGLPTVDTEPCSVTPPTDHYWSYWHGVNGSWVYSTVGAAAYPIGPGMVDGWSYGAGSPPRAAVPVPEQPPPPPPPPAPATTRASAPNGPEPTATEPTTSPSEEPSPTPSPSTVDTSPVESRTPTTAQAAPLRDSGPAVGTIVGLALVVALATVAVVVGVRRRRRQDPPDLSSSTQ